MIQTSANIAARQTRAVARNLITPVGRLNLATYQLLTQLPGVFNDEFIKSQRGAAWNHEDTAGNPIHLAAVLPTGALFVYWAVSRREFPPTFGLSVAALVGWLTVPVLISHGDSLWSVRFQVTFFMLWGVPFAAAISIVRLPLSLNLLSAGLLVSAYPYVLLNNMRPVIGIPPWPTRTGSVFLVPARESLLAIVPHTIADYSAAAERIQMSGCRDVGLSIGSRDLEYAFWWLLDAPQSGIRLKVINPPPETVHLVDANFDPCAVLCTQCGMAGYLAGLERAGEFGGYQLHLLSEP